MKRTTRSNQFDKDALVYLHEGNQYGFLDILEIVNFDKDGKEIQERLDAFHHIFKRNKYDELLSSIFNALPVNNKLHLEYHGRLLRKEKQEILLNALVERIFENIESFEENNIMFNIKKFITKKDIDFLTKYKDWYSEKNQEKIDQLINKIK